MIITVDDEHVIGILCLRKCLMIQLTAKKCSERSTCNIIQIMIGGTYVKIHVVKTCKVIHVGTNYFNFFCIYAYISVFFPTT